jgi:NAD(P)H-quinone oxidoreductase subunit 5
MESNTGLLLASAPLLPLMAGLLCLRASARESSLLSVLAASGSLLVAVVLAGIVVLGQGVHLRLAPGATEPFTLRMDVLAATMAVLVSFLGLTVQRFSKQYLAGDPRQARFHAWMCLTLASVLLLVLSGNLLLIWFSWVAMSLCLHRLLLHFPERPGAVFSARKKFVVSRLGDACLLAAVVLVRREFGTWELERIFGSIGAGGGHELTSVGFLLVACACLKSAQFPFHSWLPDTMETPTPVSALMHAGIINAGGFLLIRLSPLFRQDPEPLRWLTVVGSLTAAFAAVVMLAQPTAKRALAFSTIAQMGFMMLQCGVGAFGLALVHIIAHSIYKAHAFLHAGSGIGASPRTAIPLRTPGLVVGAVLALILVGGASVSVPARFHPSPLLALPLGLAITYGLARQWSAAGPRNVFVLGLPVAAGMTALAFAFHALATLLPNGHVPVPMPRALTAFVAAVFVGLFLFQVLLWRFRTLPFGRRIYVHALNGFYVGTYANRALSRLWPKAEAP